MCSSGVKRWVIGLLLLTVVAALAAGYLMSRKPTEQADKGTLVRAAGSVSAAGSVLAAGDCL